jgi:hypothetical protein
MTDRDDLFTEVEKRLLASREADFLTDDTINDLVNFITDERKRIMWPVAIAYWKHPNDIKALWEGIDKSIILAGITWQNQSPNANQQVT